MNSYFNPLFTPLEKPWWTYLHGGKALHARLDPTHITALCGVSPKPHSTWHNTTRHVHRYVHYTGRERSFCFHCGLQLDRLRLQGDAHGPALPL